jgi:NADH-quinone oxidoreductase subunit E
MLSDAERQELELIASRYPTRQTAAIDGLLALQRRRGWISDEALADLAGALEMTPAELDSVATFYSRLHRRRTGRHVIAVCDSVSCYLMGGEDLLRALEGRLGIRRGQTTPDGAFTLLPAVCLGHCEQAPAMTAGQAVHGHLTLAKVEQILSGLRAGA